MKKYFFLICVAFFLSNNVSAQTYVTIPDVNFRLVLVGLYPSCFNATNQMDISCSQIQSATSLYLNSQNISNLDGVQYFVNLETLSCSNNSITQLGELPNTLLTLIAENNVIATISHYPENLAHVEMDNNLIETLPEFPQSINYFSMNNNNIRVLPEFPAALSRLFVGNNNLTTIPTFPEGMYDISCYQNKLTTLPNIPASLTALFCGNNFLTSLPTIPESTLVSATNNCFSAVYLSSIVIGPGVSLTPNRADCSITTGIHKSTSILNVNIFPNPASDLITVSVSKESTIMIYNSSGQLVIQKNILKEEELDVHLFTPGMYYYIVDEVSGKLIIK